MIVLGAVMLSRAAPTSDSPVAGVGSASQAPTPVTQAAASPAVGTASPSPAAASAIEEGIQEPTDEPSSTAEAAPTGVVRRVRVANTEGQGANMRREPNATSQRVKVVREGTELELIGADQQVEGRTWRNVQDDGGDAGWILSEFLIEVRDTGPRPTPTPLPLTIQVTDLTSPVSPGGEATLTIATRPGVRCEVRPLLFGPRSLPREGLEPKVSDERGECSWTWIVPPEATAGTWRYQIIVGTGERQVSREVNFGVR